MKGKYGCLLSSIFHFFCSTEHFQNEILKGWEDSLRGCQLDRDIGVKAALLSANMKTSCMIPLGIREVWVSAEREEVNVLQGNLPATKSHYSTTSPQL